ncbi:MAG: hypothetical protein ACK41C_17190 [Phenylobacterium sp.]|jgi:hypothetical protein|uniref:hypothetical protein n=1 Tax=Phenylobacterium sp. TaxID=1871053 RepID=UPI00391DB5C0
MWIRRLRRTVVAILGLGLLLGSPAHAQNSPEAQRVFDRARLAMGGPAAWNALRGLHETGKVAGRPYHRWVDPLRYGIRTETHLPEGLFVEAYNGAGEWRILPDGIVTGSVEREVMAEVRSDAFFGAYGYFFPSRFDLRSTHEGVRQAGGRSFDVLRVQPAGGEPRDLWFDRGTGLLGFVIDETGPKQGRTELMDYRRVGQVLIPFRAVAHGGGRPRGEERVLERIVFPTADRNLFSLPPPGS